MKWGEIKAFVARLGSVWVRFWACGKRFLEWVCGELAGLYMTIGGMYWVRLSDTRLRCGLLVGRIVVRPRRVSSVRVLGIGDRLSMLDAEDPLKLF